MTLKELLVAIHNKTSISKQIIAESEGLRVEQNILEKLRKDGTYISITSKEYKKSPFYKKLKYSILSSNFKENILNEAEINKYFKYEDSRLIVHQPHGSKKYPDFLLIYKNNVLPLEIKFSTKGAQKPVWNSGYPRSKAIYIFGSYLKQDVTSFVGDDYLLEPERKTLIRIMDYAENQMKENIKNEKHYNPSNFSVYVRRMYNQNFSSLKTDQRKTYEINAINLANKGDF